LLWLVMETLATLMTIKDLSNYMNIKAKTIYAKVESGEIPHYKIGGLIRFKKEEIDKWLDGCRNGHKPEAGLQQIKKNRKKSSSLIKNHFDKIVGNIIEKETNKYYYTGNGKSDRIEGHSKEVNNGSI